MTIFDKANVRQNGECDNIYEELDKKDGKGKFEFENLSEWLQKEVREKCHLMTRGSLLTRCPEPCLHSRW